uniref:Autophagy-related protein 2 n=1 Tax=Cajanus cajan TaxID=3821 RepID=A0A151UAL0_CAJCA|nr:Autophagy-related protein 2 [Cajanus cajan]
MFPWRNIAKSAEAAFSRLALKRVCKFFLKKKLGQFILGDIDLDQLDVQLSQGTIQLTDLALNVDFINAKFLKKSSLMVKEGSIGYLLIKMPWSGKGCEVEVNGLELVVSPCTSKISNGEDETCGLDNSDSHPHKYNSIRTEHETGDDGVKSTSMDVHEGVKTIAKMIKWLLTSFHVKVTNAIVAFDPSLDNEENKTHSRHTLVLQISEIQCGTSLSEDADSNVDVLGISCLTSFVKFNGAVIEILKIDNESGAGCGEPVLGSNITTCPVMTGNQGGINGNIKLSIPWKNGSLDVCKVDADVCVGPMVLRFQPSTIKWLLQSWETLKSLNKNGKHCTNDSSIGCTQLNSTSTCHSSTSVSITNATSKMITSNGNLLHVAHLISDWVPLSTHINHKDRIQELDFGASVDQFFECFDGMRNSQSALGGSGMWNWTYSVFSAITAASTLASGSLHIPPEQQHMETNLRATFAGISVVLSFCDDEQNHYSEPEIGQKVGLQIDYLGVECNDIVIALQICPQGMTLDGNVKHVEVANFLNIGIDAKNQSALVQHLQAKVLDAIPSATSDNVDSHSLIGSVATDSLFGNDDFLLKVTLFRTSGVTSCKFSTQSSPSDGCLTGMTSFSLNLPPFIFWVIFSLINVLMNLLKEVESSLKMLNKEKEILSEASDNKYGSPQSDLNEGSSPCVTSFSTAECLHCDISLSNARVILCFPFGMDEVHANSFSWEQFIALDFTSSSPLNKGCSPDYSQTSTAKLNSLSGIYSVDHLQETGYVKVAQEAFMEAILKTNCASGLLWELELSKSHLYVETCYDTTAALILLAAQLQQLFAPDVEESLVHLQNRWENVQQAQQINELKNEILSHELTLTEGSHTSFLQEGCFPEIIESYCLSDLRPLSELSLGRHSDELSRHKLRNVEHREIERGSGGWYGGTSLKVLENHISEESKQAGPINAVDHHGSMRPFDDSSSHGETCGRLILKKIDIRWKMYGGSDWPDSEKNGRHSERDTSVCLELALSGMKFQYDIFPVLGYYHSKGHPRESYSKAFKLDLEAVRPDPLTPLEEYRLNIAFLPMLLHLHQFQLDFLVNFFGRKNTSKEQFPNSWQDLEGSKSLPEKTQKSKDLAFHSIAQEALLPYFQAKGVELNLKHVHASGIYGWASVCETAVGEWLEDISHKQIHKILRGLPTVRSLIAVGAGAAKLVSSPVESYKKERRVLKGVQRGTIAFLRSISLEAVGLGVHLAAGAHDILLQAEYILASLPSPVPLPVKDKSKTGVRSNQPKDAQEGIQQAVESLSDGLGKSAAVLVQNPLKKFQRGSGAGPALASAVRAVPAAAIAPASACASAVHYALLGFRNSLDPERKKESMEKYCPTKPWEEG